MENEPSARRRVLPIPIDPRADDLPPRILRPPLGLIARARPTPHRPVGRDPRTGWPRSAVVAVRWVDPGTGAPPTTVSSPPQEPRPDDVLFRPPAGPIEAACDPVPCADPMALSRRRAAATALLALTLCGTPSAAQPALPQARAATRRANAGVDDRARQVVAPRVPVVLADLRVLEPSTTGASTARCTPASWWCTGRTPARSSACSARSSRRGSRSSAWSPWTATAPTTIARCPPTTPPRSTAARWPGALGSGRSTPTGSRSTSAPSRTPTSRAPARRPRRARPSSAVGPRAASSSPAASSCAQLRPRRLGVGRTLARRPGLPALLRQRPLTRAAGGGGGFVRSSATTNSSAADFVVRQRSRVGRETVLSPRAARWTSAGGDPAIGRASDRTLPRGLSHETQRLRWLFVRRVVCLLALPLGGWRGTSGRTARGRSTPAPTSARRSTAAWRSLIDAGVVTPGDVGVTRDAGFPVFPDAGFPSRPRRPTDNNVLPQGDTGFFIDRGAPRDDGLRADVATPTRAAVVAPPLPRRVVLRQRGGPEHPHPRAGASAPPRVLRAGHHRRGGAPVRRRVSSTCLHLRRGRRPGIGEPLHARMRSRGAHRGDGRVRGGLALHTTGSTPRRVTESPGSAGVLRDGRRLRGRRPVDRAL